jgi:D-alanyl-D-alanine carboxypeptidase
MERARIDELIQQEMTKRKIPGLSAVVVRRDKPHDFFSYGLANLELRVPTSERSVYALASVTKQFTAAAVMALVEDGLIDTNELSNRYLAGMPGAWDSLRVNHLLVHTSGIPSFNGLPEFRATNRQDRTPRDLLQLIRDLPLDFQPGERCQYSNSNYLLLGLLISHINGTTYADFMQQRFFGPLGMTDTRMERLGCDCSQSSRRLFRARRFHASQCAVLRRSFTVCCRWVTFIHRRHRQLDDITVRGQSIESCKH